MKKRFIFALSMFLGLSLFLAGCSNKAATNNSNTNNDNQDIEPEETDRRYEIYLLAKQSGYTGTYEEWLESIRGDSVMLQVSNGNIQWKYSADSNWTNLISLTELTGQDGKEVEFSATLTHVVWRYAGESTWNNLFEIPTATDGMSAYEIAKEAGFTGTEVEWLNSLKGAAVELRVNNGTIEWKNKGDNEWNSLVSLSDLAGKDAKEIELSTTPTHIVWRHVGDTEWTELAALPQANDGKSAYEIAQELGFTGTKAEWLESLKGASIELRVNNGAIEWKNTDETNWTNLISLSELTGSDGREVEFSTTPTHIVWRYKGDTEWTNLLEIPQANDGKSAYEIAQELGFEGTKEEWINSLQGRGIKKIEKVSTDGLVDTYRITFTDNTTFEYQVTNGANGSGEGSTTPVQIPDELIGFSFNEVLGMGYTVTGYYGNSETVVIPDEYNGKPVVAIDYLAFNLHVNSNTKYIVVPNTLISLGMYAIADICGDGSLEAIFYNGDLESFNSSLNRYSFIFPKKIKLYIQDENGNITKNGIKYSEITELDENNYNLDTIASYEYFDITTLVIDESIVGEPNKFELFTQFNTLDEIYFDGSFEDWLLFANINNPIDFSYNKLFLLDENGDVTHNDKQYKEYNEITVPNYTNESNYKYLLFNIPNDISFDSITLSNLDYLSKVIYVPSRFSYLLDNYTYSMNDYNVSDLFTIITSNNITLYYDGDAQDLFEFFQSYKDAVSYNIIIKYLKENTYVLDNSGDVSHNNKKYIQYYDTGYEILPSYDLSLQTSDCVWNPLTLTEASQSYDVSGEIDAWIVYNKNYGTTYNGAITKGTTVNPIDNRTYSIGDTLPAWSSMAQNLGLTKINQGAIYGDADATNYDNFRHSKESSGVYRDINGNITDIFYNTTINLNSLGDEGELIDLLPYVESGKMPAVKKFLTDNPILYAEILHNGHMYYTPYLDGFQAAERVYMMDTTQVEKLFDNTLPTGTGLLDVGTNGNSKGLNTSPQVEPFIDSNYNYPNLTTSIDIVDPTTSKKVTVTVNQTTNIIKQQNELIAFGCTGVELINQFKRYAQAAYGDIIETYYDGSISKMFTSVGACYNADDLVALLRIFKANPDVLYGSATQYDEVVPVFPRGRANNRIENILHFAATLYGVQGKGSEYDRVFFGADGKLHDFDTQTASYDMLEKVHALYAEGLIEENFWTTGSQNLGVDTYFKKTANNPTFGLMEYDYITTQSSANDIYNGIGTKSEARNAATCGYDFSEHAVDGIMPILSPLTYLSTESYAWDQSLNDKTGKTLERYYEENRTIKSTSWSIPAGSDNVDSAIALMDFMFTKEGWAIQNFGPEGYWDYGTVLGRENTPIIKQAIYDHFATCDIDFWNYCRGFIGSTQGIGHYRPITLDYQACNIYGRIGYENIELACSLGVQKNGRCGNPNNPTWSTSSPIYPYPDFEVSDSYGYAGLSQFWQSRTGNTAVGWVAIVVNGSNYTGDVLTNLYNAQYTSYTYSLVKSEIATKNQSYLYRMGESLNKIPPEAMSI